MRFTLLFLAHFCKDCSFFKSTSYDTRLERSVCLQFNERLTEICREDETKCGIEGKFFVAKEKTEPPVLSCKCCKYYDPAIHRCKAFRTTDSVTGRVSFDWIELCRTNESKCGKYGKFFTPYKI